MNSLPASNTILTSPLYNDTIINKCSARISSIKTPMPHPVKLPSGCGVQPEILAFDTISCEHKEFEFSQVELNVVLTDKPCKSVYEADSNILNLYMMSMNQTNGDSIPKSIDTSAVEGLYAPTKFCNGVTSTTVDYLTYSANSLINPQLLDVSTSGFTYNSMLNLIVAYKAKTKLDTNNLYIIMDGKNFQAFLDSYIAKYGSSFCCVDNSLRAKDGVVGNAPGASAVSEFRFFGIGTINVILDDSANFQRDAAGHPYMPLFNGGLIGMVMNPTYAPVNYESMGIKELSNYKEVRLDVYNYGMRQSAADINLTPCIKINIYYTFGVVKFHQLGQMFIKGM
ncbi:MAG: hypothetical protein ACRCST_06700 [Turicibacter sp.]